jgi:hypothetical protein
VLRGVRLAGFVGMVLGVQVVAMGRVGVFRGFGMMAAVQMLRRGAVMPGSMLVMVGRLLVMVGDGGLVSHATLLLRAVLPACGM